MDLVPTGDGAPGVANHAWSKGLGGSSSDQGWSVAVDKSGNVFVTGTFVATVDFGSGPVVGAGSYDIFLVSYTKSGVYRFSKTFGSKDADYGLGVAVDPSGNIYLTGYIQGTVDFGGGPVASKGSVDVFLASFTNTGAHRFSKSFGANASASYGTAVTTDQSGNLFLAGYFAGTADFGGGPLNANGTDLFLASFTNTGAHRFSKCFGDNGSDYGKRLAVDSSGNIYLTGHFQGQLDLGGGPLTSQGGTWDMFLASFTNTGAHRFSKRFGDGNLDYGTDVAVDPFGNVYLTGRFYGAVDFGGGTLTSAGNTDMFLASFTQNGAHRFSKSFGGVSEDTANGVAADKYGNAYITGYYYGTADFGGGALQAVNGADLFVASFTNTGAHRFSKSFGTASQDYALDIAVDSFGSAHITGYSFGSLDLGGGPLVNAGSADVFLLKLTP